MTPIKQETDVQQGTLALMLKTLMFLGHCTDRNCEAY